MLLADVDFMDIFWSMLWFFFLFMWIMIVINVFMDLFRNKEESGASKVIWFLFILFMPFLAVFIYILTKGQGMAERQMAQQAKAEQQFASYVQQTASAVSPADQIANAKALLDAGTISQAEFDQLKAKALA
jgi:hypothetical protein